MATQTVTQQTTRGITPEKWDSWNRVRGLVGSVAEGLASCFRNGRLEYMEGTNPAGLSRYERTDVECDVLGISGPYR
jgi:hypothetical protein